MQAYVRRARQAGWLTARVDGRTAQSAQAFASAVESAVPTVRAPSEVLPYASGLFSAFPDLRFELHVTAVDEPYVVAQWTMIGTQSGPLNGLPPTEARIKLPGIDVITLGESGLLSVEGYFDHPDPPRAARRSGHSSADKRRTFWRLAHPSGSAPPIPASRARSV